MKQHRATTRRTVFVGDSEVDLATARAGGVRICLARYGFGFIRIDPSTLDGREWYLDQPQDLLALLQAS
jgi:phosphoglycolate phosphatase-like HAD superfamily hydrolase